MTRKPRIAVIGGGIGGLTAAQALLHRGFEVSVHEAAPELKEIGAGVSLSPNAMKALRSLDLEDGVRSVAWQSEYQYLKNWRNGRIISKTPTQGTAERYGARGCTVHRADLLDVLGAALPPEIIHLGARCTGVENVDGGAVAHFNDGKDVESDIVVGADGIHSGVRASLFGPDAPRFTGKICWRCLVPVDAIPGGLPTMDGTTWLGPHGAVVVYPVRRGELVNVVAHYDNETWTEESWIRECDRSEVIENYAGWHESLARLFSASERHYKWALYDREPLQQWTRGRATILGDAAHPMLPYLGQGACQAMEDGCVLATALDSMPDDVESALKLYERVRVPRASRVVLMARDRGEDNHLVSPWAAFKRDALIAIKQRLGKSTSSRGGAWIFEYDAGSPDVLVA
ncbi:MAG TPA: FAD-dependent monooxygenase [Dehalococcoidia bacterium]|nr:FAD-dependent monooxygenase [Dehalococcoidia bacterium]